MIASHGGLRTYARRARERFRRWRLRHRETWQALTFSIFCSLILAITIGFIWCCSLPSDDQAETDLSPAALGFSDPNEWVAHALTPVPEPTTLMLFGAGAAWLIGRRKGTAG